MENKILSVIETKLVIGLAKMLYEDSPLGKKSGPRSMDSAGHVGRMKGHTKRIRKGAKEMGNSEEGAPIIGSRGSGREERGRRSTVKEPTPNKPKGLGKGGKHTTRADALGHGNAGKFTKEGKPAANPKARKTGMSGHDKAIASASKKEAPLSKKQVDSMGTASNDAKKKAKADRMETLKKVFQARKAKKGG